MSVARYLWRQLNQKQREELLAWRKARGHPWHSPPHRPNFGHLRFLISAACYEHRHYIGHSLERMNNFTRDSLAVFGTHSNQTLAWCVLPNHYHALVEVPNIKGLLGELGSLHGRTSHAWNREEGSRGRKIFFRAVERAMRSERHYWATLNYVHHNPVKHGYAACWTDCHGAAQRITSSKQEWRRRNVFGGSIRYVITAKVGTRQKHDLDVRVPNRASARCGRRCYDNRLKAELQTSRL